VSPRADRALLGLLLAASAAWLVAYGLRAAFHSDELNVLWHAMRFATGEVGNPGRPGLLFLVLAPVIWLGKPATILLGGRAASIAAAAATLGLLAWLGRPQDGEDARGTLRAPLAVLLAITAGLWATPGIELRTDTFTTPLSLLAVAVLWRRRWTPRTAAIAAGVVAAAVLISQKSAYNTVGLAAAWLLAGPTLNPDVGRVKARLRDGALAIGVGAGLLLLWFFGLSLASSEGTDVLRTTVGTAANTAFGAGITAEQKGKWLLDAYERAPLLWTLAGPGFLVAVVRKVRPTVAVGFVAIALLAVFPIHRGFFPYYIASIEPLLALPAAEALLALGALGARLGGLAGRPRWGAAVAAMAMAGGFWWSHDGGREAIEQGWGVTNQPQMELTRTVDAMFPEPVPYLAGINLVPGYPELGGYLTSQNREAKRKARGNFISALLREAPARFFVRDYMSRQKYLRTGEKQLLYNSYLPVAPNLYVHGARIRWEAGQGQGILKIQVFIDGEYSVARRGEAPEAPVLVEVDGRGIAPGDRIPLSAGFHDVRVGAASEGGELWLVLGENAPLEVPRTPIDHSMFPKDRNDSRSRYQRYDRKRQGWDLMPPAHVGARKAARRGHARYHLDMDKRYGPAATARRGE